MGVRASQVYTGVLGQAQQTGEVRVRRMYADVLVVTGAPGVHNVSASSTLNLTDQSVGWIDIQYTDHTLNLTDSVTVARNLPVGVSHTLNLISLGGRTLTGDATNNLTLNQVVVEFNYVADRSPVGNTLNLTQTVIANASLPATSSLNLTQNVVVQGPIKQSITQWLSISQHTSTPYRVFIEDELSLTQYLRSPIPITRSVSHTLNLVQNSPIGNVLDTLNLTDTVTFSFGFEITSNLTMTDNVSVEGLWVRTVEQALEIGHALTWYEDTPCTRKQYTPFQGENTINTDVDPPPTQLIDPQGSTSDRFSLYTPPLGVRTSEVIIRAPELDNRDRNAYSRVNRETRGGYLTVFADPNWPRVRTLAVTIVGLTEAQIDELQTFLQDTVGQMIGLTDWEGRLWQGFITNPNEVATQDGKCRWTVTLEFEGEMLDVQQPDGSDGSTLNLTHTVTVVKV